MNRSKARSSLVAFAAGVLMMFVSVPARAGIPVIDVTAIVQAVLDVMNGLTQIENQYQQIVGLERQIESISNARSLGDVLNNQALQNYVPREANTMVRSLESGGYGTLGGASKALRDAQMTFMEDALTKAKDRVAQINSLMRLAGATTDQKEIQEVTARIGAENALLQHEVSQIELMRGLAEADQRVAESRSREGQLEQASRNRRLADFIRD